MKFIRSIAFYGSAMAIGCLIAAQVPPIPQPAVRRVALAAAAAPAPVQLRISWSYPTNELSPDLTFRVYHSTTLTAPVTWELQTSVVGTNAATVVAVPGVHFYAVKTYSQFWDQESDFSDAVATPASPKSGTNLTITR